MGDLKVKFSSARADENSLPQGASLEAARREADEYLAQHARTLTRTGWAYPAGLEGGDARARMHHFTNGGRSACGAWDAPLFGLYAAFPHFFGQRSMECQRCGEKVRRG